MSMLSTVAPWDTVAEGYSETTMRLFRSYIETALELVSVGQDDHIADIACGPGTLSLAAANRVASVKALDFSENMLGMLRKGMSDQDVDNIEPLQGDGQSLPYEDNIFDAAFSMFGLMFFPDRAKGFSELYRTLKPGGRVCVSSWAPVEQSTAIMAMFSAMQLIKPDIPDPKYDVASLENPEVLKAEMRDAGFRDVVVHKVSDSSEAISSQRFWDDMVRGSAPVLMLKNSMTEEVWSEKSKLAIEHIEKSVGPFPVSLSATAWLGVGVKQQQ